MGNAVDFIDNQAVSNTRGVQSSQILNWLSSLVKRGFDITFSLVGLFFLSPLFLYALIRIPVDSPGPVYYRGRRAGKGGKEFKILKFRTMYERPESYDGLPLTAEDDSRITRFGEWLSRTKLNELPQLWNVLIGEMSFVGPRPEDFDIAMQWSEDIRAEVLSVRPGMTSPASVIFRDEKKLLHGSGVMDIYLGKILPEKLRLDQLYVRQHTFIGDLDVIFMTLILLLPGLRKINPPERQLYAGPLFIFGSRYFSWFVVDAITAMIAISVAGGLWRLSAPLDLGWDRAAGIAVFLALSLAATNTFFGLKKVEWRHANPIYVFDLACSTALSLFIFWLGAKYVFDSYQVPFQMLVDFGIFIFFGLVIVRYRERLLTGLATRWVNARSQSSMMGERVLVIGAGECGQLGIWLLEKSDLAPAFSIVGIVDDDFHKQNLRVAGRPVLGTTREISEIVKNQNIGVIVFAINKVDDANRERILNACHQIPVRVIMIPDLLKVVSNYLSSQTNEGDHANSMA